MEEVKKRSPDQYRQRIEDDGCPNCGAVCITGGFLYTVLSFRHQVWNEWRCPDEMCPNSDGWTNVYEDLENTPF